MKDYIDRQAAIDALAKHEKSKSHNYTLFVDIVSECAEIIRDLPSVEVEPVKHGEWIKNEGRHGWHCSVCREDDFYAFVRDSDTGENKLQDHYCPNCGSKMDLEGEAHETD